jgi:hypothetical protein
MCAAATHEHGQGLERIADQRNCMTVEDADRLTRSAGHAELLYVNHAGFEGGSNL